MKYERNVIAYRASSCMMVSMSSRVADGFQAFHEHEKMCICADADSIGHCFAAFIYFMLQASLGENSRRPPAALPMALPTNGGNGRAIAHRGKWCFLSFITSAKRQPDVVVAILTSSYTLAALFQWPAVLWADHDGQCKARVSETSLSTRHQFLIYCGATEISAPVVSISNA